MSNQENINTLLHTIIERLDNLDTRLTHIERATLNMDHHISFVENIYDTVKLPFHSLMGMVQSIAYRNPELPPAPQELLTTSRDKFFGDEVDDDN